MLIRSLLLILFFSTSAFAQREILEDPTFKKKDKYWFLRKGQEYNKLKAEYKKETLSLKISHTSEAHYLCLLTPAPLKKGRHYQFSFEFKGDGEGMIKANYRNHNNVFKRKKNTKNHRYSSLGLMQKLSPKAEWQKATMYFTALENPVSDFDEFIILMFGEFQGEISLRNLSLKEAKDAALPLGKFGKMDPITEVK
ncbi:hypothetical protein PQO01_18910 [Lentisphaera marina]|uniref:hypothetical protein n=1 Tax=Lentisphaera marina TaxID=1111041 RepID=UPI002365E339|nr:hypothetical protein [Lentisphaera marina]MDD7987025.1 hypothetical protein [Lentisphaera marina]